MKRRATGIVNVVAGLIVGLVVGLGAMYVLAPSIIGSSTISTPPITGVSTVIRSTTVTSTVGGSGATTVTETTADSGIGSTVTTTVGAGATATITSTVTETSTIDAAHGFFGGPVFVDIAPGTGANQSLSFSPSTITVVLGVNSTVIWTNHDSVQHTVTANQLALFNSQALDPDHSFGYTFAQPGTYGYSCQFHGYMVGKVIVRSSSP